MKGQMKLKELQFLSSHKIGYILVVITAITALALFLSRTSYQDDTKEPQKKDGIQASPDTFIPNGYVLIPIMVSNFESLNALVSGHAIVNLYAGLHPQVAMQGVGMRRQIKTVAERIKLIRSPLNPEKFAVLAPESQAEALIRYNGEFFVTIQNPSIQEQVSVRKETRKRNLIEYLEEESEEKASDQEDKYEDL